MIGIGNRKNVCGWTSGYWILCCVLQCALVQNYFNLLFFNFDSLYQRDKNSVWPRECAGQTPIIKKKKKKKMVGPICFNKPIRLWTYLNSHFFTIYGSCKLWLMKHHYYRSSLLVLSWFCEFFNQSKHVISTDYENVCKFGCVCKVFLIKLEKKKMHK